ncbi:FAD-dependent oxidoreductase [Parahaliea sp. F7430]|uniref:FAD-dependent oxidoreductase n=1 Tax=Sediminihaliea albiluteola TaxID=2758564 RepID=A0A7W2TXJ7_9GAMM|nr:FAD-dependent oxidoreductase [Sediminihaliea albiluteola]MBA6413771.1 FAD-dependent oxidoreductase [Sediminihaliea albiluteola]
MNSASTDYDVIVIGAGGAGMTAAITAAKNGARVALLEAWDRVGGSTALSGGYLYATGTKQQKAQAVDDSPERMYEDIRALNGDSIPEPVLRRFIKESADTVAWVESLGVKFPTEYCVSPDGIMPARAHAPEGNGLSITEKLDLEVNRCGIDLALNTRVQELLKDDTGAVTGVRLPDGDISAGAVIIACGGIGGDPALLDEHCPKTKRNGDWRWYVGCQTNRGDGLRLTQAVGGKVSGKDSGLFLMTPNFHRDLEVIGPAWVMMVNSRGERIMREDGAYWAVSEALEAQPDGRAFAVFSHEQMLAAEPDPRVLQAIADGTITLNWTPEVLTAQQGAGRVLKADTLAELGRQAGLDPAKLEAATERYNRLAKEGNDVDFGKDSAAMQAILEPPFYAVEVRPALAIVTGAGPAIDGSARVLSDSGGIVPGLYAAGETTGNVYGRYYVGSGYAINSALTFGRVAGQEAASFALQNN